MGVTTLAAEQGPHRICGDAPDGRVAAYLAATNAQTSLELAWA
jgi:hypothetical protein